MAEIGSGNGTDYPNILDVNLVSEVDNETVPRAAIPNDLAAASIAVETELGEDPAGSLTDVKTFLQTEHGTDGTHATGVPAGFSSFTLNSPVFDTTYTPTAAVWPSFRAHLAGAQSIPTGGTPTLIDIDTVTTPSFDKGGDFDGAGTFTANVAGKYFLSGMAELQSVPTGTIVTISIFKNTVLFKESIFVNESTGTEDVSAYIHHIVTAAASDTFSLRMKHDDAGSLVLTTGTSKTLFRGSRVA